SRARRTSRLTGSRARRSRCTLSIAGTASPVRIATTATAMTTSTRVKALRDRERLPVPDVVFAFHAVFTEGKEVILFGAFLSGETVLVLGPPGVNHRLVEVGAPALRLRFARGF